MVHIPSLSSLSLPTSTLVKKERKQNNKPNNKNKNQVRFEFSFRVLGNQDPGCVHSVPTNGVFCKFWPVPPFSQAVLFFSCCESSQHLLKALCSQWDSSGL